MPITSSTLCDQVIFVDHASDVSPSSDAVGAEVCPEREEGLM